LYVNTLLFPTATRWAMKVVSVFLAAVPRRRALFLIFFHLGVELCVLGFEATPWLLAGGLTVQVHRGFVGHSRALSIAQRAHLLKTEFACYNRESFSTGSRSGSIRDPF